jgi:hypothetical protein
MLVERKTTQTWKLHKCTQIKNLNHLLDPAKIPPPPTPLFRSPYCNFNYLFRAAGGVCSRLDCEEKNSINIIIIDTYTVYSNFWARSFMEFFLSIRFSWLAGGSGREGWRGRGRGRGRGEGGAEGGAEGGGGRNEHGPSINSRQSPPSSHQNSDLASLLISFCSQH